MGYTTVNLRTVSEGDLVNALTEAHARAGVTKTKTSAAKAKARTGPKRPSKAR